MLKPFHDDGSLCAVGTGRDVVLFEKSYVNTDCGTNSGDRLMPALLPQEIMTSKTVKTEIINKFLFTVDLNSADKQETDISQAYSMLPVLNY